MNSNGKIQGIGNVIDGGAGTGGVCSVERTDRLSNSSTVLTNGIVHPKNINTDTVHTAEDGGSTI